jgi:anti-sigma factor RsiW
MNPDLHKNDPHIRAKELLVTGASAAEQHWLEQHLAECTDCAATRERAQAVRAALHSVPVTASPAMVEATQKRMLRHALELSEREARRWMLTASVALATLFAWITVPLLWQASRWVGDMTAEPQAAALAIFLTTSLLPALLAGAAALALRHSGTSLHFPIETGDKQ